MQITVRAASLQGTRSKQQDVWAVHTDSDRGYAVVCDGIGGHAGGREAAEAAVKSIAYAYAAGALDQNRVALIPALPGVRLIGGTTIVGVLWQRVGRGYTIRFFSVGDSYGFLMERGEMRYVTPVDGNGKYVTAHWNGDRHRAVSLSPALSVTKTSRVILASDGLDPVLGELPSLFRTWGSPGIEFPSRPGKDFWKRLDGDLTALAEDAVARAGQYADNTTVICIDFKPV